MTHVCCALALALLPFASAANPKESCPCVEWAELDEFSVRMSSGERCVAYAPGSGFLSAPPSSGQEAFCYPSE